MGGPLALNGRRLMGGHNNQPKVGVDIGRGVGEETRPGWSVCGGCLFVPGGELNEIKIEKNVLALGRWPLTGQNNNQPKTRAHNAGGKGEEV